jgi:hypothetical protein
MLSLAGPLLLLAALASASEMTARGERGLSLFPADWWQNELFSVRMKCSRNDRVTTQNREIQNKIHKSTNRICNSTNNICDNIFIFSFVQI